MWRTTIIFVFIAVVNCAENRMTREYAKCDEFFMKTVDQNPALRYAPPPIGNDTYPKYSVLVKMSGMQDANEIESTIKLLVYHAISWNDQRLKWTPSDCFKDVQILPPNTNVWYPPFIVFNSMLEIGDIGEFNSKLLRLKRNGDMMWFVAVNHVVSCEFDYSEFPSDFTTCHVDYYFFEARYTNLTIDALNDITNQSDPDWFEEPTWKITETSFGAHPNGDPGNIRFKFKLHRRPLYTILTLLLPTLVLTPLPILTFLLPADSGEKMGVSLTTLLTYFVMSLTFFAGIPAGRQFPQMGLAFLYLMMSASVATFFTAAILGRADFEAGPADCDDSEQQNENTPIIVVKKHTDYLTHCCASLPDARAFNRFSLIVFTITNLVIPLFFFVWQLI